MFSSTREQFVASHHVDAERLSFKVGQTHTLPAPDIGDINRVAWFPDGSNLAVSGTPDGSQIAFVDDDRVWHQNVPYGTSH